ncbi:hypothetical protein [Methanoregula sp.]|uniref:hypothetical protein n=1 Tax=Methanoregula sp. TaxID=2052170 RepID=UPI003BB01951
MTKSSDEPIDPIESVRLKFQLTFNRNERLASYIRITDGAIWGFLGVAFFELFKDNFQFLKIKILIFSLLVIVSMILWRQTVHRYQKEIVKGYVIMIRCENKLQLPPKLTLAMNMIKEKYSNWLIEEKYPFLLKEVEYNIDYFQELEDRLIDILTSHQYQDENHLKLDKYAEKIQIIGLIVFIVDILLLVFQNDPSCLSNNLHCCDLICYSACSN